jgi:hypothetical protein
MAVVGALRMSLLIPVLVLTAMAATSIVALAANFKQQKNPPKKGKQMAALSECKI